MRAFLQRFSPRGGFFHHVVAFLQRFSPRGGFFSPCGGLFATFLSPWGLFSPCGGLFATFFSLWGLFSPCGGLFATEIGELDWISIVFRNFGDNQYMATCMKDNFGAPIAVSCFSSYFRLICMHVFSLNNYR